MSKKLTIEQFIEKAKEVHENKYDYSKSVYKGYDIPLRIICPLHGEFMQKPHYHLSGSGCYECGKIKSDESKRKNIDQFIEQAKRIHSDNLHCESTSPLSAFSFKMLICSLLSSLNSSKVIINIFCE